MENYKYSVEVTKMDGMKAVYHVASLSAGGAECEVLHSVYAAKYALATAGWPAGVLDADLTTVEFQKHVKIMQGWIK